MREKQPRAFKMSLAQQAVRGAAWTVSAGLISRFLGLIGTLALTRFLAPAVMGEVVTATVVAFMASWATQLGINQYILVRGGQNHSAENFHATLLSLGLAVSALALVAVLSSEIGQWLNSPDLGKFLPGMALAVFIRRVGGIPEKLLLRQLRFRAVAGATALGEISYTVTAIVLVATTDLGGQSIVLGNIVQAGVIASINVSLSRPGTWLRPVRIEWSRFREILKFGYPLGIEAFLYEFARYGDKLFYTRFFGLGKTGEYNLAYNLADLPSTYVGEQVSNVLLPMMMQVDAEKRKSVLVRALGLLALVTFPMAIGLAVIAQTLVDVLLPDRWLGVAPFLAILAAVSLFRPVNGFISQYLISLERNQRLMGLEFLRVGVLFGGLFALAFFGPIVAAAAVGLAAFAHTLGLLHSIHSDRTFLWNLVRRFHAPALSCAIMAAIVMFIRTAVGPVDGYREGLLLAAEIGAGAVSYVLAMLVFGRGLMSEALALVRGMRGPRRVQVA